MALRNITGKDFHFPCLRETSVKENQNKRFFPPQSEQWSTRQTIKQDEQLFLRKLGTGIREKER